jgi:hypothetical protein
VEYATREQAQNAIQTLSNQSLMGRLVYVREVCLVAQVCMTSADRFSLRIAKLSPGSPAPHHPVVILVVAAATVVVVVVATVEVVAMVVVVQWAAAAAARVSSISRTFVASRLIL